MTIEFKRLTFEKLGEDEEQRHVRMQKGLLREITTSKFTIPFSTEGTYLYDNIDRNSNVASYLNRNVITELIINKYPDLEIIRFGFTAINQTDGEEMRAVLKYLPTGEIFEASLDENIGV